MSTLPTIAIAFSAALFVTLSAIMNALFLSSLGRTPLEAGLFAALSVTGDVTKAVLPVVIVRAAVLRAWVQLTAAALMLVVVIALSLASGTGFAALTRGTTTATRQADTDTRSSVQRQLRDIDGRLERLPPGPSLSVMDAEIARIMIDRRWTLSKSCSSITTAAVRQFCGEVLRLKSERAVAEDRVRLEADRTEVAAQLATRTPGAMESDPQAAAVAELLGVDTSRLRRHLNLALAITVELGSVILILLLMGPALRRWRDPDQRPQPVLADLPHSNDVASWHRRRNTNQFELSRSGNHA